MKGVKLEELGQSILEQVITSGGDDVDRNFSNPFYAHIVSLNKSLQKVNGKSPSNWTESLISEIEGRAQIVIDDLEQMKLAPSNNIGPNKLFIEAYKILAYTLSLVSDYKDRKIEAIEKEAHDQTEDLKIQLDTREKIAQQEKSAINGRITELVSQNFQIVQQNEALKAKISELQAYTIKEDEYKAVLSEKQALMQEIQKMNLEIEALKNENRNLAAANDQLTIENRDYKETNLGLTSSEMNTTKECQRLLKLTNEQQSVIKEMENHIVQLEAKANNNDAFNAIAIAQDMANKDLKNLTEQRKSLITLITKMENYITKIDEIGVSKPIEITKSPKDDGFHLASDVSITGLPESVRIAYKTSIEEAFVALVREFKAQSAQVKLLAGLSEKVCTTIGNSQIFVNQFANYQKAESFKLPARIRNEITRILSLPENQLENSISDFIVNVSKEAGIAVQAISKLLLLSYKRLLQGANNALDLRKENDLLQEQMKHQISLLEQEKASNAELREVINTYSRKFESPIKITEEPQFKDQDLIKLAKKCDEQKQIIKKLKETIKSSPSKEEKSPINDKLQTELVEAKRTIEEQKLTILNLQQREVIKSDHDNKNFEEAIANVKQKYESKLQKLAKVHEKVVEEMNQIKKNSLQGLQSELDLERQQRSSEKLRNDTCLEDYKRRLEQALQTDAALKLALERCTKELNETRLSLSEIRAIQKTTEARAIAAQQKLKQYESKL
ncbi:hypothetical protein TVAG_184000 [Trichomonas vaginalis G3]|uniref:Uncharacterized protein n=1 Tax=Trichomonas vaginalis (strain ATCC PRA-98 / G3) TaxID=412133 RepID=A2D9D7_TRIV3|nr:hypothetical protein TVAGG3_0479480 [Trichomonas vaginalis G3]EAY23163.1 hypothetical protein TVAG_184000 [Trichomonas vaginalis G3]KAI5515596.1 hypothetical protein TVAGG3_0479480 [Trichomonas vaginalis G3]|eukprot:XP_001584149.1 hypothetical protein [Trichomonas vaginalis G3]